MPDPIGRRAGVRHQTDRSVRQHQPNVNADQSTAAPENKAHETANACISFHPGPIINPNDGQILHVVKHLEEGDPH